MGGRYMRAYMDVEYKRFNKSLYGIINRVGKGTKKATTQACKDIKAESLRQVPRNTNTLAASAFYEVTGSSPNFEGIVGYGGNGDPINPITGLRASDYMVAVHEDLSANYMVGKAKFLEDPIRQYANENFPRTVMRTLQEYVRLEG